MTHGPSPWKETFSPFLLFLNVPKVKLKVQYVILGEFSFDVIREYSSLI